MTNYTPTQGASPVIDSPCAILGQLRAALYALMAGQQRAEVRNGDQWLRWHQGNVTELREEVRRLELLCGAAARRPRAVRVGNY
ncbi:gpW family head-tail joining protein [Klebsiella pneumoniae]|uniref:gpW family head-tail joining protein n=1 Tax=Klebsiella pneumoniae TaxID=573 RepID=UPI003C6CE3AF